MKFGNRLNSDDKKRIKKLYLSGLSQQKIGSLLGKERTVIGWWVRKFGIQRNLSESHKGQHSSFKTEFKRGHKTWNKGKPHYAIRGEKNPVWKGGVAGIHNTLRSSDKYKQWRRDVFVRDKFTCEKCGHRYVQIVAHHIKTFADYPQFRFDINNGITMCRKCHCKLHKLNERKNHVTLTYTGS